MGEYSYTRWSADGKLETIYDLTKEEMLAMAEEDLRLQDEAAWERHCEERREVVDKVFQAVAPHIWFWGRSPEQVTAAQEQLKNDIRRALQ